MKDLVKRLENIAETNYKLDVLEQLVFAPQFRMLLIELNSSIDSHQKEDQLKRMAKRIIGITKEQPPELTIIALQLALLKQIDSTTKMVNEMPVKDNTKQYIG